MKAQCINISVCPYYAVVVKRGGGGIIRQNRLLIKSDLIDPLTILHLKFPKAFIFPAYIYVVLLSVLNTKSFMRLVILYIR